MLRAIGLHLLLHRLVADDVARGAGIGAAADLEGAVAVKAEHRADAGGGTGLWPGPSAPRASRSASPSSVLSIIVVISRPFLAGVTSRSRAASAAGSCPFQSRPRRKVPRVAGASVAPEGPPCGGPEKGASNAPARRLVAIRSALRNAWPSLRPVGLGADQAPLRCATRTAGRNAGGFPGRHPGTAAGPSSRLLATRDSAGAGADHLPQRPAPDPRRRPSAGRDGRRINAGGGAGISGAVMPGEWSVGRIADDRIDRGAEWRIRRYSAHVVPPARLRS